MNDYPARFDGVGDRFVALYLELAIDARGRARRDAARRVAEFFARPAVVEARAADDDEFAAQLADGARRYFESCLNDGAYGSTMFGLKRMTAEQVRSKMRFEHEAMLASLAGADAEQARIVSQAQRAGFEAALGG